MCVNNSPDLWTSTGPNLQSHANPSLSAAAASSPLGPNYATGFWLFVAFIAGIIFRKKY